MGRIMKKVLLIITLLSFLPACASAPPTVYSNVIRFHDELELKNKRFVIIPHEHQKGGLEFKEYSGYIKNKFLGLGAISATDKDSADYAVFFRYGIDNGREAVSSYPIFGQTSSGGVTYHYNSFGGYGGTSYTPPTYGVVGAGSYSFTRYARYFNLDIISIKKSTAEDIEKEFEGSVTSSGLSSTFSAVSRCLIDAMFEDFPGESGQSKIVRTLSDDCIR